MSWRRAPAGLVSGPRTLKIVRMPSSRRTGITSRMAGCSRGAKRKAMPTVSSVRPAVSGEISIFTPRAASTSALPERLETERLPCLATAAPAAAATRAAAVEMLKVPRPSPPVPQVSTSPCRWWGMAIARWRMAAAAPEISATASPFMRRAISSAAFIGSLTWPSMSWPKRSSVSSWVRLSPPVRRTSAARTSSGMGPLRGARLPAQIEEISQQMGAGAGEHRLGVELHPQIGEVAVAHPHQRAVVRPGERLQLRREGGLLHLQAVIAGGLERVGQAGEDPHVVMADGGGLAVHQPRRPVDGGAERHAERLVAEADAQQRDAGPCPEELQADPGVLGAAGAGREDDPLGPAGQQRLDALGVVAHHHDLRARPGEHLHQVVGERVVVVDHQDHDRLSSSSASATAVSSAAALFLVSRSSEAGSESATMPAPAVTEVSFSRTTRVRMAMQVSRSPEKER